MSGIPTGDNGGVYNNNNDRKDQRDASQSGTGYCAAGCVSPEVKSKRERSISPRHKDKLFVSADICKSEDCTLSGVDIGMDLKYSSTDTSNAGNISSNVSSEIPKEQTQEGKETKSSLKRFRRQSSDSSDESVSAPKSINAVNLFETVLPDSQEIESICKEGKETKSSLNRFRRQSSDSSDESVSAPKRINAVNLFETVLPESQEIESICKEKLSLSSNTTNSNYLWSLMMRKSVSESDSENETEVLPPIVHCKRSKSKIAVRFDLSNEKHIDALPFRVSSRFRKATSYFINKTNHRNIITPYFLIEQEPDVSSEILMENIMRLKNMRKTTKVNVNVNSCQTLINNNTNINKSGDYENDGRQLYYLRKRKVFVSKLTKNKSQKDNLKVTSVYSLGKSSKRMTRNTARTEQRPKRDPDKSSLPSRQGKKGKEQRLCENNASNTKRDGKDTIHPNETIGNKTSETKYNAVIKRNLRSSRNQHKETNNDPERGSADKKKDKIEKEEDKRKRNESTKKEYKQKFVLKKEKQKDKVVKKKCNKVTPIIWHYERNTANRFRRQVVRAKRTRTAAIASGLATCLRLKDRKIQ